jgi:hypothetical protein
LAETPAKLIQRQEGVEAWEGSEAAEGKIKGTASMTLIPLSAHLFFGAKAVLATPHFRVTN